MATIDWIGKAHANKQISTLTVGGTWLATETLTLTINGKDIIITIVSGTTTDQVAESIRDAWINTSRLDGTNASNTNTSNAAGGEFGEFLEATPVIYTTSTSVVRLIGSAGRPFTLTVAETSTSGTLTLATPQAATGPWHWDNGDNWSGGAAPANDDVCVFKDSDVPVKYGLPNASLEVTLQVWMSYTAQIGLPVINRENGSKPYYEYRQRYVRLDDAGAGTNIAHRFGIGNAGTGPTLINLKHSTLKCSPIVYNTGTPQLTGTYALNICCTANTSTLEIINGSVDFSSQDGSTSAFVNVQQSAGNSRGIQAIHTAAGFLGISGGTMLVGGTGALATILSRGGTLRLEGQTGTITACTVAGGTIEVISIGTITTLDLDTGAFDATNASSYTLGTTTVSNPVARFLDPAQKMSIGTVFTLLFDPSTNLRFGASPNSAINISHA